MNTEHEKIAAVPTGRRYDSVDALMKGEGLPPEVQAKVKEIANETRIALQLANLRQRHGLTQEQMAVHLGITQSAVSKLESGRDEDLTLREVREYSKATGYRIAVMFGKPVNHVEAVKIHAEGIRTHLYALARIANQHQNDNLEMEIQAFFGEAFFNILTILSKCNDQLNNRVGEFSMNIETKPELITACAESRTPEMQGTEQVA